MNDVTSMARPFALHASKRIRALLPDDGTDRHLMAALRAEMGVNAADTVAVRAVSMLRQATSSRDKLPESELARLVTVIVAPEQADAVFEFMFITADIGRPGGGMLLMDRLMGSTPFILPDSLPEEAP